MSDHTVIRIQQMGRMGNSMSQLMLARDVQKLCRHPIVIEGYDLPEWGLSKPPSDDRIAAVTFGSHLVRKNYLAALIDRFKPACINLSWLALREGNLSDPGDYNDIFPLGDGEGAETPDDRLLVNVRLGDISNLIHPDYGPLPISYYQYLEQLTGLRMRFMGELDNSAYVKSLERTFPNAEFCASLSPRYDFQTIRRAKHIAIAVSSFSWLGAYLSHAHRIHVPVAGMFDPRNRPDADLLPIRDPRFAFHEIGRVAWAKRYSDYFPSLTAFSAMPRTTVSKLKSAATRRTFVKSARVHFGIARRLAMKRHG